MDTAVQVRAERTVWRVGFTGLMALTMAMATVALAIFSVLSPFLIEDLGLSRSQLGILITGVAAGGALTSVVAGRLADRFGGRTMAVIILVIGIFVFVGVATATSFLWAFAVAAGCGFANGATNPATNKLVAAHIPEGSGRGLVMGVKQSGVQAGLVLAGIALPPAALAIGWRGALWFGALVPVAGLVALLLVVPRDPPAHIEAGGDRGRYRPSHMVRWMTLYGTLMGAGGSAIVSFLPLYAREGVGLSVTAAGLSASVLGLLGVAARIAWARRSERMLGFALPLGIIAALSIVATGLLLVAAGGAAWLLWIGTVLAGLSVAAWNAVGMLAVVSREPPAVMGRASGLINFGFLGGMSLAPIVFGWSVDVTGAYTTGWIGVIALFAAAGTTTLAWHRTTP